MYLVPIENLNRGEWAEVESVDGDPAWTKRFAELGLRPGVRLQMIQPGCPCLFDMGGNRLCLRIEDEVQVLVRPCPCEAA